MIITVGYMKYYLYRGGLQKNEYMITDILLTPSAEHHLTPVLYYSEDGGKTYRKDSSITLLDDDIFINEITEEELILELL